jgi:hypothetical protein
METNFVLLYIVYVTECNSIKGLVSPKIDVFKQLNYGAQTIGSWSRKLIEVRMLPIEPDQNIALKIWGHQLANFYKTVNLCWVSLVIPSSPLARSMALVGFWSRYNKML